MTIARRSRLAQSSSLALLGLAMFSCPGLAQQRGPSPIDARVDGGIVTGRQVDGVASYRGVPYAAAPVGDLRWREAQPVTPWSGKKDAGKYSPACTQMFGSERKLNQSEDCLYLNVFAPVKRIGRPLPVIVWFHGAGFNVQTASTDQFNGTKLATEGAIVVTVNYRLGILASLALPELTAESPHHTSGALQHLDQIAALRWVQRNISKFGGDPKRVLAFGQSSGSINVSILQSSPLAKGLFSRVMGSSGAGLIPGGAWAAPTLAEAERNGLSWQKSKGALSLAQLRALPASTVMENAPFSFPVGEDGYLLPVHPGKAFAAGRQNDVPTFAFYTRDEGFSSIAKAKTVVELRAALDRVFGNDAAAVAAFYPVNNDIQVPAAATRIANDGEFGRQMTFWAAEQSRTGKAGSFLGVFTHGPVAFHGADVSYWFGTLDQPDDTGKAVKPTVEDWALSRKMRRMLIAFAATGNPSIPGNAVPEFGKEQHLVRVDDISTMTPLAPSITWFLNHRDTAVGVGENGFVGPGAR